MTQAEIQQTCLYPGGFSKEILWLLDKCVAGSLSKSEQLLYQANTPICLLDDPDARKVYG